MFGSFTFGGAAEFLFEILLLQFSVESEGEFGVQDFFFEFFLEGLFPDVSAGVLKQIFDFQGGCTDTVVVAGVVVFYVLGGVRGLGGFGVLELIWSG